MCRGAQGWGVGRAGPEGWGGVGGAVRVEAGGVQSLG